MLVAPISSRKAAKAASLTIPLKSAPVFPSVRSEISWRFTSSAKETALADANAPGVPQVSSTYQLLKSNQTYGLVIAGSSVQTIRRCYD